MYFHTIQTLNAHTRLLLASMFYSCFEKQVCGHYLVLCFIKHTQMWCIILQNIFLFSQIAENKKVYWLLLEMTVANYSNINTCLFFSSIRLKKKKKSRRYKIIEGLANLKSIFFTFPFFTSFFILFSTLLPILYLPFDIVLRSNSVLCFMCVQESTVRETRVLS